MKTSGGRSMPKTADTASAKQITDLQYEVKRLNERIDRQKDLETRLSETLHSLQVHQEELRTQNEDLVAAQKEITKSHRKYRDLFDFAPIGYFLVDASGAIIEVNLTAANMIGRHRDSLNGKPLFLYIDPDYRPVLDRHLREIWEGRPASAEVVFVKKNKEILPVEFFSIPVSDKRKQAAQCRIAATDISKRWRAEEALKESERKLSSIVNTIPDIVYRLDRNGMINFISEGIRRYGYRPEELLGKPMMSLVHPQDRPIARHGIAERRTGDRSTNGLELRLMPRADKAQSQSGLQKRTHKDRFFMVNAEGLYTDSKHPANHFIGTQGIAHDITSRKLGEIKRMRLEAELNKARKMEAIGTLAGGIAHDFNNLLMGIQGNISLMRLDMHNSIEIPQRLEGIERCIKHGSELTRQMLGFAKSGNYNVETIDINKIVEDTVQLFARSRKTIKIYKNFGTNLWNVDADRGQVEQVLLNLLINSEQAMPDGGQIFLKTERIKPEARQLKRLGLKSIKYVRILVEDTGIGMDKKTQNRIFEPFFTTKEVGRGTGLGLASAYGIIKNHGGMIDVVSTPGRGSRFFVYLPASNNSAAVKNETIQGVVKGNGTILLVDDEDIIIEVGGKMLERLGYRVIIAQSGTQAVEIYQHRYQDIDMVVLDMIMPHTSGFETYNRLKEINPEVKVLLSSGYSDKGQSGEIVARDKQSFIQKPFDLSQLSRKIASMLSK
jgi:two-component system cell cycle sensor histidine kinase/response regulator CckA